MGRFRFFGWLMLCGVLYQAGLSVVIALAAFYAQLVMKFDTAQTMTLVLAVIVTAAIGLERLSPAGHRFAHLSGALATITGLWLMVLAAL